MLISHFLLPGERNKLKWDGAHARSLFRYGRWVFVSTLFTFLARRGAVRNYLRGRTGPASA
jgi:hypothetical protein